MKENILQLNLVIVSSAPASIPAYFGGVIGL